MEQMVVSNAVSGGERVLKWMMISTDIQTERFHTTFENKFIDLNKLSKSNWNWIIKYKHLQLLYIMQVITADLDYTTYNLLLWVVTQDVFYFESHLDLCQKL